MSFPIQLRCPKFSTMSYFINALSTAEALEPLLFLGNPQLFWTFKFIQLLTKGGSELRPFSLLSLLGLKERRRACWRLRKKRCREQVKCKGQGILKIGFYYLMQQIIMAEEFEIAVTSDFQKTGKSGSPFEKEQAIFGPTFQVQDMSKPTEYLPQYQQSQFRQKSFVETCNTCCGLWCICCAYPFALLCCKCCCVYELPTATAGIVEEFGKFSRLINPGFNMINPCTEEIREVDMRIKIITPGANYCITKDNVKLTISSSIAYRVVNPIQVYYILGNQLNHAIVEATHSSIRNVIGETVLDDVLLRRAQIIEKSRNLVLKSVPAGVVVENMFIEDIAVPPQTMQALSSAARQKRTSEANIINSKADVESASLLKEAAELLDTKAAMQIRYLEMVTQLGKKGAKLLLPIGVDKKGFKN